VVVSLGVVEHFEDTELCMKALSRFLKPGGIIITMIPNLAGMLGVIFKLINRAIYDIHKIILKENLDNIHKSISLNIIDSRYFILPILYVININGLNPQHINVRLKGLFLKYMGFLNWVVILGIEKIFGGIKVGKFLSSYIIVRAKKKNNLSTRSS
jgi:hypothetical protein